MFTVPTEIAEMAAIILGFCKDRAIQTEDCAESDQRSVVIHSDPSPMIALSPELAFLVRYAELQQCFIDGNVEGAVDRLIDLLVTGSGGPGSIPVIGSSSSDNGGSCAKVSTRLRLRLLSEVNHLLGKQCVRRDQVELLLSALTELRLELSADETHTAVEKDTDLSNLLAQFHVALVRELASTFLRPSINTELPPLMDVDAIF
ncbi:unnamed protein product [Echinostoma caproni]|uniref:Nuclear pore complex protein n=1 Tax=Echinostoma caproni TaxID=27848 RepID=A0A183BFE2_9TREM|nr:unnamed protein product [Echinostoma caproni]